MARNFSLFFYGLLGFKIRKFRNHRKKRAYFADLNISSGDDQGNEGTYKVFAWNDRQAIKMTKKLRRKLERQYPTECVEILSIKKFIKTYAWFDFFKEHPREELKTIYEYDPFKD